MQSNTSGEPSDLVLRREDCGYRRIRLTPAWEERLAKPTDSRRQEPTRRRCKASAGRSSRLTPTGEETALAGKQSTVLDDPAFQAELVAAGLRHKAQRQ